MFSPQIIGERVSGMLAHYPFVSRETLAYFTARPDAGAARQRFRARLRQGARADARPSSAAVLAALEFKCDVLWVQLDALWSAYVDGAVPPGAWRPAASAAMTR